MKTSWLVMVTAGTLIMASGVYAKDAPKEDKTDTAAAASDSMEGDCKRLRHTVTLSTNSDEVKTFEQARDKFDVQLEKIRKFAESKHFAQFGLVSIDYALNTEGKRAKRGNNSYKMKATYKVANQDDAAELGDYLVSKKLNANVSVKNPCNAQDIPGDTDE